MDSGGKLFPEILVSYFLRRLSTVVHRPWLHSEKVLFQLFSIDLSGAGDLFFSF
jgi:hypothetical protein